MDVLLLIRRYLVTRPIAAVATLLVIVAVAAMVIVTSVMDGFRTRIHGNIRTTEADLTIRVDGPAPAGHEQQVADELKGELSVSGGPIEALAPRLLTVGLIVARDRLVSREIKREVRLVGIHYPDECRVVDLKRLLSVAEDDPLSEHHRCQDDLNENPLNAKSVPGVFVGRSLARRLGLTTDPGPHRGRVHEVTLVTGRMVADPDHPDRWKLQEANAVFRVAGVFDSGREEFDGTHVLVDIEELHGLRYGPDSDRSDCTSVRARLTDSAGGRMDDVVKNLRHGHPGLIVETWKEQNRSLMDALDVEKYVMSIVLGFIVMLTVGLILGLLYMMVLEKTRDVGVLRSMGFPGSRVVLLFFGYGSVLGAIGSAGGVALGVAVVQNLNPMLEFLGIEVFSRQVPYRFHDIPTVLDPLQVTAIGVLAVILSMLSGALAAWRAAVIDPIECLRYE